MRTITPALEALLRSRFQTAGSGFAARFEVDIPGASSSGGPAFVQDNHGSGGFSFSLPGATTPGNLVVLSLVTASSGTGDPDLVGWTLRRKLDGGVFKFNNRYLFVYTKVASGESSWSMTWNGSLALPGGWHVSEWSGASFGAYVDAIASADPTANVVSGTIPATAGSPAAVLALAMSLDNDTPGVTGLTFATLTEQLETSDGLDGGGNRWGVAWTSTSSAAASYTETVTGTGAYTPGETARSMLILVRLDGPPPADPIPVAYTPKRAGVNRNLRMGPDQLEVELQNENLALGFGPTSVFPTNSRCRLYQWFGDSENEVLTFTGVIDKVNDSRDPLTTTLTCRSLAGPILVDQTFSTIAPQDPADPDADLSDENGVWSDTEVSDIVTQILWFAGWPADQVDVLETSMTLDSFVREDGESHWDSLARLAELVGYTLWDDEDGVIHFRPIEDDPGVDEPLTAGYEYLIGAGL